MRATLLLAALAAGLVSFAAAAEETSAKPDAAPVAPQPTLVVSVPDGSAAKADKSSEAAAAPATPAKATEPAAAPVVRKPAAPSLVARINLSSQRLELAYDGRHQESWPISSGREGYPTPRGAFRPQWASKMWYSRKYDNAPMPHAVFFSGGVAVHATQAVGMLGSPASHGCVRLAPGNAARFYALVHKHGFANTRIEVIGQPPAPRVAKRPGPSREQLARGAYPRPVASAYGPSVRHQQGWMPPAQQPLVRRGANGLVYLPQGSPYRGQSSFVMNGVTYIRVR